MKSWKRKIRTSVVIAAGLASLSGISTADRAPGPGRELPSVKVLLDIGPVLIDSRGFHPLNGPGDTQRTELGFGGAFYQTIFLTADREHVLMYRLGYQPLPDNRVKLTLEPERKRGGRIENLPRQETTVSLLDTWSPTLLDDPTHGRIVLRVLPILREEADDEPLETSRIVMQLQGGPLIQYGPHRNDHRVVFTGVGTGGEGVEFGITGVGAAKLHLRPFPGAERVGWVRGHTLYFAFGEREFQLWSTVPILPEDPSRPGKGWVLFGKLAPLAEMRHTEGYYGVFKP